MLAIGGIEGMLQCSGDLAYVHASVCMSHDYTEAEVNCYGESLLSGAMPTSLPI